MRVYTCQMAKHRRVAELGITLFDTTIKSGCSMVAPTWEMVKGSKEGTLSNEDYTTMYKQMLITSAQNNWEWWKEFLNRETLCLACYCKAHGFCHRYILIDFIRALCLRLGKEFEYLGEIE